MLPLVPDGRQVGPAFLLAHLIQIFSYIFSLKKHFYQFLKILFQVYGCKGRINPNSDGICCFNNIFRHHVPFIYKDSVRNRKFRCLIINWLKHKFVKVWIDKVVTHMRMQIQTTISSKVSELNDKQSIVLNDNDVNRIFGWALFKVKNKYVKLINKGSDNKLFL